MNTELDSTLAVWGGRIMLAVGIFGWSQIPLFFAGIDLLQIQHSGTLGLGAIIGAIFGGIGSAIVIRSHQYKKIKKEIQNNPCSFFKTNGKHDYVNVIDHIKQTQYDLELPAVCKSCGKKIIKIFNYIGVKDD